MLQIARILCRRRMEKQIAAGAYFARVWNIETGQPGATLKGTFGARGQGGVFARWKACRDRQL